MKFASVKIALAALSVVASLSTHAVVEDTEILQPFTDEMALEMGMTPADQVVRATKGRAAISPSTVQRLIQENKLVILVNKAAAGPGAQRLTMYEEGQKIFETKVSTGTETMVTATSGRRYLRTTPVGYFRPVNVYTMYYSNTWKSDMPNAVFLVGGIAIHATPNDAAHAGRLGQRASGGCVRVKDTDSKFIREKVMESGNGAGEGQFTTVTESYRRWKVTDANRVSVPAIRRADGVRTGAMMKSWDTVVVVHE